MSDPPPDLPPRTFDARQERIYAMFGKLSPGAAALFKDTCKLVRQPLGLECLTHIVGHLCRETESALRDIVRPLHPTLHDKKRDNKDGGHKREITAFLEILEIDAGSAEAAAWHSLAGKFHKLAHRDDLRAPRPLDDVFEETWRAFNETLDAVLTKLGHHHARYYERIDALMKEARRA